MKMEHYEIYKLLNDSTVSKFVTKKWIKVNYLSSGQYSVNEKYKVQNFNAKIRWLYVTIAMHLLL